jgi:hypothetical protein
MRKAVDSAAAAQNGGPKTNIPSAPFCPVCGTRRRLRVKARKSSKKLAELVLVVGERGVEGAVGN